ncbi:HNH endonuclease signature motif containing protein [Oryzobacter telluris]|uniref:HNH endonuclease signature motif containing protein n=1 Tax=Oryzobacter telluris TaxID=3149179 RepID=UPI00370D1800
MDVDQGSIVSPRGVGDTALVDALTSASKRLASRRDLPEGRDELAGLIAAAQVLVNTTTALQDAAIAKLATVESDWAEDGTLIDVVRGAGHVALDTADLVAPCIGASHAQAQRRVDQAVRLAAARIPVVDDPREVPQESGLAPLHEAMREGRLDGYSAGVVAFELAEVPAEVAETVVAALDGHLGIEPAAALRRRCRRLLARISPDLLRQRAERARRETGLRRWVAEPGVDAWWGTFPSEDAASAWAAIDELARQYVADGVCSGIDRARAKALTDLVAASSTVTYSIVLTVPEGEQAGGSAPGAADRPARERDDERPTTGAGGSEPGAADRPARESDDRRPTTRDGGAGTRSCVGQGDDLVEVRGLRPSEASLVSREWLAGLLQAGQQTPRTAIRKRRERLRRRRPQGDAKDRRHGGAFDVEVRTAPCHRETGAILDASVANGYRPPDWLVALVRSRDGRCRFPGCSVAARFCDLDHVRPWPIGRTEAANLACLCRRHHRIKQRAGWRVRMLPGALMEWTDPTGRVRTTHPIDALAVVVLAGSGASVAAEEVEARPAERVTGEFSTVEFDLEHLLAATSMRSSSREVDGAGRGSQTGVSSRAVIGATSARRVRVETCRTAEVRGLLVDAGAGTRPGCGTGGVRTRRHRWPDEPPF